MADTREYRFLDPEKLDTSNVGHIPGSNAQCLADALLDLVQISRESGMTEEDVEEALRIFHDTRADLVRARFRLHIKKDEEEDAGD